MKKITMEAIDLTAFDLFKNVPLELINEIMSEHSVYTIPAGQHLVKRDFKNSALYLLLEGEVEIYLDEKDKPLKIISAGDIIGEISMLDQQSATASAISLCECRIIIINEELIWELVEKSHLFTINLLHIITNRFRGVNSQVISSIQKQRLFEHKAIVDDLTKLYNRGWLNENFPLLLERCKKDMYPFSYFMIDIDHFKKINDTYGHQVGDFVLQLTGEILNNLSRAMDYVVRYGGEEMAMLLPNTNVEDALGIAERVRHTIEKKVIIYEPGKTLSITVSIGVSTLTRFETSADLIKSADEALYYAKVHGRNQIKFNDGKL
ncbi:MAG: GGDEF domain-containing protein [Methylobacter sp.]|nr:MAG: GGDEF domain-containing protein [Methylobacter sp.]